MANASNVAGRANSDIASEGTPDPPGDHRESAEERLRWTVHAGRVTPALGQPRPILVNDDGEEVDDDGDAVMKEADDYQAIEVIFEGEAEGGLSPFVGDGAAGQIEQEPLTQEIQVVAEVRYDEDGEMRSE